jgi:hypothetical protein
MCNRRFILGFFVAGALSFAPCAGAADGLSEKPAATDDEAVAWGGLVFAGPASASVEGVPEADIPVSFAALELRLRKVFPAERYTLVAQHTETILKDYESWVVPGKELFLKIDSRGPAGGGGTRIDLQVWSGDKILVKTDAVLRPDRLLFVAGPSWRGGRLLIAVSQLPR